MIVYLDISGETFVAVEEEKVYPLTCWLNLMLRDQMPSGRPQVFHRLWIHHFTSSTHTVTIELLRLSNCSFIKLTWLNRVCRMRRKLIMCPHIRDALEGIWKVYSISSDFIFYKM